MISKETQHAIDVHNKIAAMEVDEIALTARCKEAVGILLGVTGHLPQDDAAIQEAIKILKGSQ